MRDLFQQLTRFWHRCEGVAATEFALVGPVLVLVYVGCASTFDLYNAQRQIVFAANGVSDIVSRSAALSTDDVDDFIDAGDALLGALGTDPSASTRVSSVFHDVDRGVEVAWSRFDGGFEALETEDLTSLVLPDIPVETSVIVVEIHVQKRPIFFVKSLALSHTVVRNPRFVESVTLEDS